MTLSNFSALSRLSCKTRLLGGCIAAQLSRFKQNISGIVAIETVLMMPIMVAIPIGLTVAIDAITASRRTVILARTLADLTTQSQVVTAADIKSIFDVAETILWPQPATKLGMRITSFIIGKDKQVFVDWSFVRNTDFTPLQRCSLYLKLPNYMMQPSTSVVMAEVTLGYEIKIVTKIANKLMGADDGTLKMSDKLYMRPRIGTKVAFSPAPTTPVTCKNYLP